jgi:hypothetical protein
MVANTRAQELATENTVKNIIATNKGAESFANNAKIIDGATKAYSSTYNAVEEETSKTLKGVFTSFAKK